MLRKLRNFQKIYHSYRTISCSCIVRNNDGIKGSSEEISSSVATKFQVFRNESVGEILDIEEERAKLREREEREIIDVDDEEQTTNLLPASYSDLNLDRKNLICL